MQLLRVELAELRVWLTDSLQPYLQYVKGSSVCSVSSLGTRVSGKGGGWWGWNCFIVFCRTTGQTDNDINGQKHNVLKGSGKNKSSFLCESLVERSRQMWHADTGFNQSITREETLNTIASAHTQTRWCAFRFYRLAHAHITKQRGEVA